MLSPAPHSPPAGSSLLAGSRVLIADDHTLFRHGFELLFALMFPEAQLTIATDADQAIGLLETTPGFALVILDLSMSGMNGMRGVRRFVQHQPAVPVIILSAHAGPNEILECIRTGARAYIPKTVDEIILKNAISLVMAGETFIPSEAISQIRPAGLHGIMGELADLPADNPLRQLTARQCDTLALIVDGLSNKEVARRLGLLESTVKTHVKVILKKLNAQNRTQAAMIANDLGWPRSVRLRSSG